MSGEGKTCSFRDLHNQVCKFANASRGVKKEPNVYLLAYGTGGAVL